MVKFSLENLKSKFIKEKYICGIDIGSSSVKTVKVKIAKDILELENCACYPLDPNLIDTIKKIKAEFSIESAVISFSGTSTVVRYAQFPKMTREELAQALRFEAQKYIPFTLSDTYVDGYILKDDLPGNKMSILIAAVKKELVNQRLKMFEDAQLKVEIADLDSLACANSFLLNYSDDPLVSQKAVALLN
ncbi:MAG: pilus assembly protein PilM, partial [Candidatus Omnitrophica bacterium]|nr:pilus assembly protein PilM [Candidatus Omnitrophota bacterium]